MKRYLATLIATAAAGVGLVLGAATATASPVQPAHCDGVWVYDGQVLPCLPTGPGAVPPGQDVPIPPTERGFLVPVDTDGDGVDDTKVIEDGINYRDAHERAQAAIDS